MDDYSDDAQIYSLVVIGDFCPEGPPGSFDRLYLASTPAWANVESAITDWHIRTGRFMEQYVPFVKDYTMINREEFGQLYEIFNLQGLVIEIDDEDLQR